MSQPRRANGASPSDKNGDTELLRSLKQLSISTTTSPKPGVPSVKAAVSNGSSRPSPGSPSVRSAPKSPQGRVVSSSELSRSRSSTPTLLRKTSMSSIHSSSGFTPTPVRAPSRRSSTGGALMSPSGPGSSKASLLGMPEVAEARPPMTAASVAEAHFRAELDALHHVGPAATTNGSSTATAMPTTNTLVVLHDSCYGHRYSRPRTSRSTLSSIVERPERLLAAVLGVAAAYVRLGERHAEGSVPPVPQPDLCVLRERAKLPFRILRTTRRVQLGSPAVTNVHGTRWMDELKIMCDSAEARLAMNGKELQRPDMGNGRNGEERKELHEGDLYLCAESLEALEGALGAVCEAVDAVFTAKQGGPSRAFVAIRPPGHHCSVSYPSGFCWINNVHVGIMHAMLTHGLTHAAIIDFDLHHGDGSQAIAWQHNTRSASAAKNAAAWKRTSIGYFSLHDINSYPCEMGNEEKVKGASICIENAHGQNVWNVHLQPWRTEAEFWQLYETRYAVLLEKARNFLRQQTEKWRATSGQEPKGAVFLSAGFDASEWESSEMQRHAVNVPTDFYARMSRDVVKLAAEKETACEGRVISVLEGGYSDRAITSGVLSHLGGLAGEDPVPIKKEKMSGGLAFEMGQRIGALGSDATDENNDTAPAYDPAWWTVGALEKLEAAVHAPPPEPKKPPRSVTTPTYSSPTQSSAAKVVLVPRVRRSVSGLSALASASVSRAPTPPPPDVDWPVAAHELSKLLIPSDRTTTSCKPEELSAEATRARRDRQSLLLAAGQLPASAPSTPCAPSTAAAGPVPAPVRMALRERKPVAKPIGSIDEEAEEKPQPDRGRRKSLTLGEKTTVKNGGANGRKPGRPPGRRNSVASTVTSAGEDAASPTLTGASETTLARPGSSHSLRAESTVVVKPLPVATTAAAQLTVKKTRPSAAGSRTPKPAATKTAPRTTEPKKVDTKAAAGQGKMTQNDVDSITTGLKRIKINLITKAQREARDKAAAAAQDKTLTTPTNENGPVASDTPAAPASVSTSHTKNSSPVTSELQTPTAGPAPPARRRSSRSSTPARRASPVRRVSPSKAAGVAPTPAPRKPLPSGPVSSACAPAQFTPVSSIASSIPLPDSSPIVETPTQDDLHGASSGDDTLFVPYQPEGPTPTAVPLENNQQRLRWLPPNVMATPTPMKRADLPVFTATSAIPFAVARQEQHQDAE